MTRGADGGAPENAREHRAAHGARVVVLADVVAHSELNVVELLRQHERSAHQRHIREVGTRHTTVHGTLSARTASVIEDESVSQVARSLDGDVESMVAGPMSLGKSSGRVT